MIITRMFSMAALAALVFASQAQAVDPAVKCETSKLKEVAKYSSCRLKAEAKAVQTSTLPDFSKCEAKFTPKFTSLDTKYGTNVCPTENDEASINARVTSDASDIAALLSGGSASDCGNAVVEAGEDCDFGDLDGQTCTSLGLFGQGLACTPGTCLFDTSACSLTRYEDTGLTVIDHQTGLEWQKTDDDGGLTDKDNLYSWTAGAGEPNGTAFTVFLAGLNGGEAATGDGPTSGCYAGHCDWRMPLVEELTATLDCSINNNPCLDPSFGALKPQNLWTLTSDSSNGTSAWRVFGNAPGFFNSTPKTNNEAVRAVRRTTATLPVECTGGETLCSGSCFDLNSDPANCGSCGNACTAPAGCINGVCEDLGCFLHDGPGWSSGSACAVTVCATSPSCCTGVWDFECAYACTLNGGNCAGTCNGLDGTACQAYTTNSACQACIDNSSSDIYRFSCSFASVEEGCDPQMSNTNACDLYANFADCDSVCCP